MYGIVMYGIASYVSSFIERSENIFHLVLYLVADSRCYTRNYRLNEEEFGNRIQSSINIGVRNRVSTASSCQSSTASSGSSGISRWIFAVIAVYLLPYLLNIRINIASQCYCKID